MSENNNRASEYSDPCKGSWQPFSVG